MMKAMMIKSDLQKYKIQILNTYKKYKYKYKYKYNDYVNEQATFSWGVKSTKDHHPDEEEGSIASSFIFGQIFLTLDVHCSIFLTN